jgi:DNA-binding beta-propeller fold protein YncE
VAVSPDGARAYVTNQVSNTVSVIDTATNTVTRRSASAPSRPAWRSPWCRWTPRPVAVDDGYAVIGGATLTVAAPGVLGNDSDADNDPLTAQLVSGPATGLTLNANGSFTFTPGEDTAAATVTFTYRAFDGSATSNLATVTITVTAGCDGVRATRVGTVGNDTLTGTSGNDVIVGWAATTRSTPARATTASAAPRATTPWSWARATTAPSPAPATTRSAADRATTRCATATTATTASTAAATATRCSATPASTGCSAAATPTPSTAAATPRTAATARAAPTPQPPANSSSAFPDAHTGCGHQTISLHLSATGASHEPVGARARHRGLANRHVALGVARDGSRRGLRLISLGRHESGRGSSAVQRAA